MVRRAEPRVSGRESCLGQDRLNVGTLTRIDQVTETSPPQDTNMVWTEMSGAGAAVVCRFSGSAALLTRMAVVHSICRMAGACG